MASPVAPSTAYLILVISYGLLNPLNHSPQDLGLVCREIGSRQIEETSLEDNLNIMVLQNRSRGNSWWVDLLLEFTIELDE